MFETTLNVKPPSVDGELGQPHRFGGGDRGDARDERTAAFRRLAAEAQDRLLLVDEEARG